MSQHPFCLFFVLAPFFYPCLFLFPQNKRSLQEGPTIFQQIYGSEIDERNANLKNVEGIKEMTIEDGLAVRSMQSPFSDLFDSSSHIVPAPTAIFGTYWAMLRKKKKNVNGDADNNKPGDSGGESEGESGGEQKREEQPRKRLKTTVSAIL